ncbi:DUF2800 domain-containing protein [Litorimonas haliclonae]|uniref:DUF2800 domain-containing protein n=1 Tax=Litorimonas haliclonae TaxID=2081977 RepID=UPI0039F01BF3
MAQHAKLSASGAHRWMACPASVQQEEGLPDTSSDYAQEGTDAHDLAEHFLKNRRNAADDIDTIETDSFTDAPEEVAEYVQMYLDYVRGLPGKLFTEQRVDFSPWVPEGFGTADAIVLNENIAHVVDLKYGKGLRVDAEQNPQALLYALGALNEYGYLFDEIDTFRLVIVQPRLDHISEWDISRKDLMAWGESTKAVAEEAASGNGRFNPGEKQCQWCKAKEFCKPRAVKILSIASEGFEAVGDPIEPTPKDKLTLDEIAELLPHFGELSKWMRDLEGFAYNLAMQGQDVPDHKLVEGRSMRKWGDEEAAERKLKRDLGATNAFTKKLLSPAQAEKAYGKEKDKIQSYITKPSGKPTLVPASDKRPAIEIDPTEGFSAVA